MRYEREVYFVYILLKFLEIIIIHFIIIIILNNEIIRYMYTEKKI